MTTSKEYWDVLTRKKYMTESGHERVLLFTAGNIKVLSDGRKYLTLYQQPDTEFVISEQSEDPLHEIIHV